MTWFRASSTNNQDLILYRVRDLVFENSSTKHQDLIIFRVRDLVWGFIYHRQRSDHLPATEFATWCLGIHRTKSKIWSSVGSLSFHLPQIFIWYSFVFASWFKGSLTPGTDPFPGPRLSLCSPTSYLYLVGSVTSFGDSSIGHAIGHAG